MIRASRNHTSTSCPAAQRARESENDPANTPVLRREPLRATITIRISKTYRTRDAYDLTRPETQPETSTGSVNGIALCMIPRDVKADGRPERRVRIARGHGLRAIKKKIPSSWRVAIPRASRAVSPLQAGAAPSLESERHTPRSATPRGGHMLRLRVSAGPDELRLLFGQIADSCGVMARWTRTTMEGQTLGRDMTFCGGRNGLAHRLNRTLWIRVRAHSTPRHRRTNSIGQVLSCTIVRSVRCAEVLRSARSSAADPSVWGGAAANGVRVTQTRQAPLDLRALRFRGSTSRDLPDAATPTNRASPHLRHRWAVPVYECASAGVGRRKMTGGERTVMPMVDTVATLPLAGRHAEGYSAKGTPLRRPAELRQPLRRAGQRTRGAFPADQSSPPQVGGVTTKRNLRFWR